MILPSFPDDTAYHWDENDHFRRWVTFRAREKIGFNEAFSLIGSLNDLADTDDRRMIGYRLGMCAGDPDLLLLAGGRAIYIELKKRPWGRLSAEQRARIRFLRRNRFKVYILYCWTPAETWACVERIINRHTRLRRWVIF